MPHRVRKIDNVAESIYNALYVDNTFVFIDPITKSAYCREDDIYRVSQSGLFDGWLFYDVNTDNFYVLFAVPERDVPTFDKYHLWVE